jgi:hypothetical protein
VCDPRINRRERAHCAQYLLTFTAAGAHLDPRHKLLFIFLMTYIEQCERHRQLVNADPISVVPDVPPPPRASRTYRAAQPTAEKSSAKQPTNRDKICSTIRKWLKRARLVR